MKGYIEFWEYKESFLIDASFRYVFLNKSKIESIIIKYDNEDTHKYIIVILTTDGKYRPCGINIDPEGYFNKESNNKNCYWLNYDDADKYIRELMNE
jgi:hypothetical protein